MATEGSTSPARVGIIGCGVISRTYLTAAQRFGALEVVGCADLLVDRAKERAREFDVPKACAPDELLADPDVEMVLNLTIPGAHHEVARSALLAGKHVYNEKPLAIEREWGRELLALAEERGLRIGCAPDTFLGGGLQTARKLIDDGVIGRPLAATAFMMGRGPESWHPDPSFFYAPGGGPMLDFGPYYLTALVNFLGPVRRVAASTHKGFDERVVGSGPKEGERIPVEVPTHYAGVLDFRDGAVATLVTSFDVWGARVPRIEVYGTEGTLSAPDPNSFGGPVMLRRAGGKPWEEGAWEDVPLTHGYTENSRSIGLVDMAEALRDGRPHRASGEMAFHVLDVMQAYEDSSRDEVHIHPESTCERPEPLPPGFSWDSQDS